MTVEARDRVRRLLTPPLRRLARRMRLALTLEAGVRLLTIGLAIACGQYLLDRWMRLDLPERMTLSALIALAGSILLWRLWLRRLTRRLTLSDLAARVDRAHPHLHDRLRSAVEFTHDTAPAPEWNSPELMQAVVEEACQEAPRVDFLRPIDHARVRRRALQLGGLLIAVSLAFVFLVDARVWLERNWLLRQTPWPQATHLIPIGFDATLSRRYPVQEPVEIIAENVGLAPRSAVLEWRSDSGRRGREPMRRVGPRWECNLGVLTEPVTFILRGGDERTAEHRIELTQRPRVAEFEVVLAPPAYTGIDPVRVSGQTVFEAPAGTTLAMTATFNKPVRRVELVADDPGDARLERPAPDRVAFEWTPERSGFFSFDLEDADGLVDSRPMRFQVRLNPDAPPRVELSTAGARAAITPDAILPLTLRVQDAYGLSDVSLWLQLNDDPPLERVLPGFERGSAVFNWEGPLEAARELGARPGNTVRIWATATDNAPDPANVSESVRRQFDVLTAADFLADQALREVELRQEFERLVSAQRGLRDALERLTPELLARPEQAVQRLIGLARRQEAHAQRVDAIRSTFDDMLRERAVNRVDRLAEQRRIEQQVIQPLERLAEQRMPRGAEAMRSFGRDPDQASASQADAEQAEIARDMKAVLDQMMEWEGYREVLALLTDIIEEQKAVRGATGGALEDELEAILGPTTDPADGRP